ncbi:hypothetical protein [Zoogloea sp.]|uniref:phage integrase central domain-containing protein n=1 Tax=Zoogloea sp. TaxID=49181 RepID=UPI0035AF088E
MLPTWTSDHADKIIKRFERDVFPWIGGKPVADLNAPEVLTTECQHQLAIPFVPRHRPDDSFFPQSVTPPEACA